MWPFKSNKTSKPTNKAINNDCDISSERIKKIQNQYKILSHFEYLGVDTVVVGYNELHLMIHHPPLYIPGLKVEWMDKQDRLQSAFVVWWKLPIFK